MLTAAKVCDFSNEEMSYIFEFMKTKKIDTSVYVGKTKNAFVSIHQDFCNIRENSSLDYHSVRDYGDKQLNQKQRLFMRSLELITEDQPLKIN